MSKTTDSHKSGASPVFEIVAPQVWCHPIVLNSPHSGKLIPLNLLQQSRLSEFDLRKSEDSHVDELFAGCVDIGMPMLKALLSRTYVDLNREPHEFDPRMFADKLPGYVNTSTPRVLSGLGTIPRIVSDGEDIYRSKLLASDALSRIELVYRPYHQALTALMDEAHSKAGYVLLLDCHSMPTTAISDGAGKSTGVEVVLGDRFGTSADPGLISFLENRFVAEGLRVRRNRPYAGGFITETHGNPRVARHAIQIEINRGLYMDERTLAKHPEFDALEQALFRIMKSFADFVSLGDWQAKSQLAAE